MSNTAIHKILGLVFITDECLALQAKNPDSTSIFVQHDGDIVEVSECMVKLQTVTNLSNR